MTRQLEDFEPLYPGEARLYTCGPTVYNYAHIGNFRAYVFEDLLRRTLKYTGYKVTQVMNLTDVDDKTIRGALARGKSLHEFTKPYIDAFFEDIKRLNIEEAEHYPAATDHIPEMITLIERLFERGVAYQSEDGSVYFSVSKYADYGKPANISLEGLREGARIDQDEYSKEGVADFALWKAWDEDDGDVAWDSPWGRGRPGWHVECSAMSMKYLGETFDFHTGGVDNLFPHHTNETAQSEAATGKKFVNLWMHCAHLQVEGAKMSKSMGNFFTLRDLVEQGWSGREVRYVLLNGHYRQPLNFTFDSLETARNTLERLDAFSERLLKRADGTKADETLPEWALKWRAEFEEAIADDLNLPEALAALFGLVREGNATLDNGSISPALAAAILALLERFDTVLGLINFERKLRENNTLPPEVTAMLEERVAARQAKNWAESDRLRDALKEMGWEVQDTPRDKPARVYNGALYHIRRRRGQW